MTLYKNQILGSILCQDRDLIEKGSVIKGNAVLGGFINGRWNDYSVFLRVEGRIEGAVWRNPAAGSCITSKIVVGKNGEVKSIRDVLYVDVAGTVLGDIYAQENLILRENSRVLGKVVSKFIYFDGVDPSEVNFKGEVLKKEPISYSF